MLSIQEISQIWEGIPPEAKTACYKAAGSFFGKVLGGAWNNFSKKDAEKIFAALYRDWREGELESRADDAALSRALEEFFVDKIVIDELDKLLRDNYQELDYERLALAYRASFQRAGCPLSEGNLYGQLEKLVGSLDAVLKESAEYREKYQLPLRAAVENLKRAEPGLRNFSLARQAYLLEVRHQHRLIRFRGLAEIGGPVEVELEDVFVMPRLGERADSEKSFAAEKIVKGKKAPKRLVILGGPGSGKTTLLEYLTLQLAERASGYPELFPIFYRIRHLEEDRKKHPGKSFWECLHAHCAGRLNLDLPMGFFQRLQREQGLLLLLDGLDEVADEGRRIQMVDFVAAFTRGLSQNWRVVVTSRPHDYARICFSPSEFDHYSLREFNDGEIQAFIGGWRKVHEPNRAAAAKGTRDLWEALEQQAQIKRLAHNALLLTMIVRVHWWLGQLPDSRLDLYKKCSDTLLKHWSEAAELGVGPLGLDYTRQCLAQLAYQMQTAADAFDEDSELQVSRPELVRHMERFLRQKGEPLHHVETIIDRLHKRDAILVHYGAGQFGFVHRSFQEYFAACWLAEEEGEARIQELLDTPGWNETLYLAVAQLPARRQRGFLVRALEESRVAFALNSLRASPSQDAWIARLVQFLAKFTWDGQEFLPVTAGECADAVQDRAETLQVLRSMFDRERRNGDALPAAVELAEELGRRGNREAATLTTGFFAEAAMLVREEMLPVDGGFQMDRFPVTNIEFEQMIPSHRVRRDWCSDQDGQPVIWVNWYQASLYARWRGCRLPSEQEWERAAAWDPATKTNRVYPWGNEFDKTRCNSESRLGRTSKVGDYPSGRSASGCEDMTGNVSEWTDSWWDEHKQRRVVRGGAWANVLSHASLAHRDSNQPLVCGNGIGFRCART